jgi:hypothetical protein
MRRQRQQGWPHQNPYRKSKANSRFRFTTTFDPISTLRTAKVKLLEKRLKTRCWAKDPRIVQVRMAGLASEGDGNGRNRADGMLAADARWYAA